MRQFLILSPILLAPLALGACMTNDVGDAGSASAAPRATATLTSPDGQPRGTATITETSDGLDVDVTAMGLPPGVHAVHIHTTGLCEAPDFKSAGGHWNPQGHQHGANNPQGKHMGDMPNVTADASGNASLSYTVTSGKLSSGAMPLFDADGAAIVIHGGADDMMSDPAGNAGPRIACGVIKP